MNISHMNQLEITKYKHPIALSTNLPCFSWAPGCHEFSLAARAASSSSSARAVPAATPAATAAATFLRMERPARGVVGVGWVN
jgi:hypothetical protein